MAKTSCASFVIYSFRPSHDLQPDMTPEKVRQLGLLNLEQRATVRSLLVEFAERERSSFIRKCATSDVEVIDRAVSDSGGCNHS
jgi:hypothetical protein